MAAVGLFCAIRLSRKRAVGETLTIQKKLKNQGEFRLSKSLEILRSSEERLLKSARVTARRLGSIRREWMSNHAPGTKSV